MVVEIGQQTSSQGKYLLCNDNTVFYVLSAHGLATEVLGERGGGQIISSNICQLERVANAK